MEPEYNERDQPTSGHAVQKRVISRTAAKEKKRSTMYYSDDSVPLTASSATLKWTPPVSKSDSNNNNIIDNESNSNSNGANNVVVELKPGKTAAANLLKTGVTSYSQRVMNGRKSIFINASDYDSYYAQEQEEAKSLVHNSNDSNDSNDSNEQGNNLHLNLATKALPATPVSPTTERGGNNSSSAFDTAIRKSNSANLRAATSPATSNATKEANMLFKETVEEIDHMKRERDRILREIQALEEEEELLLKRQMIIQEQERMLKEETELVNQLAELLKSRGASAIKKASDDDEGIDPSWTSQEKEEEESVARTREELEKRQSQLSIKRSSLIKDANRLSITLNSLFDVQVPTAAASNSQVETPLSRQVFQKQQAQILARLQDENNNNSPSYSAANGSSSYSSPSVAAPQQLSAPSSPSSVPLRSQSNTPDDNNSTSINSSSSELFQSSEGSTHSVGNGIRISSSSKFSGMLQKLGRNKRWQSRFFQFTGTHVICYGSKKITLATALDSNDPSVIERKHPILLMAFVDHELSSEEREFCRVEGNHLFLPKWIISLAEIVEVFSLVDKQHSSSPYFQSSMSQQPISPIRGDEPGQMEWNPLSVFMATSKPRMKTKEKVKELMESINSSLCFSILTMDSAGNKEKFVLKANSKAEFASWILIFARLMKKRIQLHQQLGIN